MNQYLRNQERGLCRIYGCTNIEEVLEKQNQILKQCGAMKNDSRQNK